MKISSHVKLLSQFLIPLILVAIVPNKPAVEHAISSNLAPQQGRWRPPIIIRQRHGPNVTSSNWSGYAVSDSRNSVTDVKGSWVVTVIQGNCPSTNQYASFWVGIDGFSSNTVEQIGTDSDCQNGAPVYYAWVEFYPHPAYLISSLVIKPGDVITAEVQYLGQKAFMASLTDTFTGQSFSITGSVANAQRSSAEWIAEAPYSGGVLPLANFGTIGYGQDYVPFSSAVLNTCYATIGKVTAPFGSFGANVNEITMVSNSGAIKAQPTLPSTDGTSFYDTWVSSGP